MELRHVPDIVLLRGVVPHHLQMENFAMSNARRMIVLVSVTVAAVFCIAGCADDNKAASTDPAAASSTPPKTDHPKGEHPKGEHPAK